MTITLDADSWDLQLDAELPRDLVIADGAVRRVRGSELVAQALRNTLYTQQGEWAWDRSLGLPWDAVTRRPLSVAAVDARLKAVVRGVPGVVSIVSWSSSLERATRTLRVTGSIRTVFTPGPSPDLQLVSVPSQTPWLWQILLIDGPASAIL